VTGRKTAIQIGELVDEIIVLEMPERFRAVAQVYRNWCDVSDEQVLSIMERWHRGAL
jgi:predicted phosphoribosyltransferase